MNLELITPPCTIAWHSLFKATTSKMAPNEPPKFSVRLLYTQKALESPQWRAISAVVASIAKADYPSEKRIRLPMSDDVAGRGWPEHFVAFLNAKSGQDFRPNVFDRDLQPVLDPDLIYPGCVVRVSLRPFGWSGKFGTGVSLGLGAVQLLADGPRLRGARADTAVMGALPTDDELKQMAQGVAA